MWRRSHSSIYKPNKAVSRNNIKISEKKFETKKSPFLSWFVPWMSHKPKTIIPRLTQELKGFNEFWESSFQLTLLKTLWLHKRGGWKKFKYHFFCFFKTKKKLFAKRLIFPRSYHENSQNISRLKRLAILIKVFLIPTLHTCDSNHNKLRFLVPFQPFSCWKFCSFSSQTRQCSLFFISTVPRLSFAIEKQKTYLSDVLIASWNFGKVWSESLAVLVWRRRCFWGIDTFHKYLINIFRQHVSRQRIQISRVNLKHIHMSNFKEFPRRNSKQICVKFLLGIFHNHNLWPSRRP